MTLRSNFKHKTASVIDIILQWSIFPLFTITISRTPEDLKYTFEQIEIPIDEYMHKLAPRISNILSSLKGSKIRFVFNIGPGSYTGIRQTLGFVMGIIAGILGKNNTLKYVEVVPLDSFDVISGILQAGLYNGSEIYPSGNRTKEGAFIQALPRIDILEMASKSVTHTELKRVLGFYKGYRGDIKYVDINSLLEKRTRLRYIYLASSLKSQFIDILDQKGLPCVDLDKTYRKIAQEPTLGAADLESNIGLVDPKLVIKILAELDERHKRLGKLTSHLLDSGDKIEVDLKNTSSVGQVLQRIKPLYVNKVNITKPSRAAP